MEYDVNIVTIHRAENFGAALQAYALKHFLENLGYKVGIYDEPELHDEPETVKSIRSIIIRTIGNIYRRIYRKDFQRVSEKYREFSKDFFDRNKSTDCKIFIAGSDQIWNPIIINKYYFLDFLPEGVKKASYAASIGVKMIPEDVWELYRKYLTQFKGISVREQDAKHALEKIVDRDIRVNVDPTFLLSMEEWREIAAKERKDIPKDFILVYVLHIPRNINTLCKWLKEKTGYKVVLIDNRGYLKHKIVNDYVIRDAGPGDFLYLIDAAKVVITTSFHGTAFSIIYRKEFYSIINSGFSSRVANILDHLGIKGYLEEETEFQYPQNINYELVDQKIENEIKKSEEFLRGLMD